MKIADIILEERFLDEQINQVDIANVLGKALKIPPKELVQKAKENEDEVNEVGVLTAVTVIGLIPAAMELLGKLINKAKTSFKLDDKEKHEYGILTQKLEAAKTDEEKKAIKQQMASYESKAGNWFKHAGHKLHKLYTAPIRYLLNLAGKLTKKGHTLRDKKKNEVRANVIYACIMIGLAGYGVASHIGHLKGVSDVAITVADGAKAGKSISELIEGALELLGLAT